MIRDTALAEEESLRLAQTWLDAKRAKDAAKFRLVYPGPEEGTDLYVVDAIYGADADPEVASTGSASGKSRLLLIDLKQGRVAEELKWPVAQPNLMHTFFVCR